jgi:hypothetical protein
MGELDPILELAEAQHGVLARHQLRRNLRDHVADDLLRGSRLVRISRGVGRVRGGAPLPEQEAFAAALRARPRATVTGPIALRLYGAPEFGDATAFEILTVPSRHLTGATFRHRVDPDPGRGVSMYGEVRVASPLDSLIDSAGFLDVVPERSLRVAWDHLRGKGLVSVDRLQRRLDELLDLAPGASELSRILERTGGVTVESEGERALAPVLGCFEPAFEPQVWVTPRRRVDFYSRRCRYGFEYLGAADHDQVAARLADDARDQELRTEGIRLGYVTKADLAEPTTLIATIAGTLTVRAHELGVPPPVATRPLGTTC